MAKGLHIRNGLSLDKFTDQFSSSYALSYNPTTGQVGYMATSSFGSGNTIAISTGSFITTGSSSTTQTITGSLTITENLTVLGTASIQYLNVIYETASVIYSSGSNQFGDATNDVQTLIGTVIVSGSQTITGSLDVSNIQYASTSNLLAWNSTTGRVSYMNGGDVVVFPYTGSAIMSGSAATGNTLNVIGTLAVTGSQQVTGSLGVTGSIYIGTRATNNIRYGGGYLNPGAAIIIEGPSGGPNSARILLHENTTDSTAGAAISFARSRAQANLAAGWNIGGLDFYRAWGTIGGQTAFEQSAYIRVLSISGSTQTSVPSAMYFGTTPSGSITPLQRIVIQENGNVGIGAVTASATLHVSGANMIFDIPSKQNGYVLQSDANGNATWVNPTTLTTANSVLIATGSVTASVNDGTSSFQIVSGSTTFMSISSSGNIGIGTTPTNAKLEIDYGAGSGPGMSIMGGASVFENIAIKIYDKGTSELNRNVIEFGHIKLGSTYAKAARIVSTNPNALMAGGGKLILETTRNASDAWNDNQLVLSNSGSIGIGTNTPSYKLEISGSGVSGSLNVNDVLYVSSSNITLNIPSKANGYLLQSDANGNATWVNPYNISLAPPIYIATGSVTASVSTATGSFNMFTIQSGSSTGLTYSNEGVLTLTNVSGSGLPTATINTGTNHSLVINTAGILRLSNNSNNSIIFNTSQNDRWYISGTGHFLAITDNVYDIGALGANRVRNIYVAGTGSFNKGLIASSSIYLPQLPTTPQRYLLTYDSASGQVYYAATSSVITNTTFDSSSFATTGSNIFIGNQTITGSILMSGSSFISGVDYIDFDTTASNAGAVSRLKWNDADGTLDLGLKGGNVTLQVGQEQLVRVVNKTGTNLTEAGYQAVRVSGAQGNRLKVDLAKGDNDGNSLDTLGLVTEDISVNQEGFVTTSGLVRGINTTGNLQGETWADGDDIYLSPTTFGGVTNIPPTAPKHSVRIGYVVQSNPSQGSIFVKVDNGYELGELHDVVDNSTTSSYGDILVKSGSIWTNSKQLSGSYGLTGSLFIIGQGSNIVSQDSYKTNDFFLVRNSTTTLKVNSGVEVSSSVAVPFKISNNTGDNILFVSQSGMVVFATSSVVPDGAAPHGAFLFTSGALYIGID